MHFKRAIFHQPDGIGNAKSHCGYRARADEIGNSPRAPFEPDPALPEGIIPRVKTHDYDGGGFDRGHMFYLTSGKRFTIFPELTPGLLAQISC
jgi:hypothetical protein